MARRPSARHARPTGRGALKAAYADLVRELAAERSARHGDQLELIGLAALADGLTARLAALSTELADAHRELRLARMAPQVTLVAPEQDPHVRLLAGQVADLRALVLAQQQSSAELTIRLVDLLDRAMPERVSPPDVPIAPAHVLPAAPELPTGAWPGGEQTAPAVVVRPPGAQAVPDVVVDDESVLRLRSVRSSLGR